MAKTILTPQQSHFLELAGNNQGIRKLFYLTGGTALAEFYLHHRLSEDIDLFNEEYEVDPILIRAFLKKISPNLSIIDIQESNFLGLFSFILTFQNKTTLKVDFNYYPFPRIQKGKKAFNLEIDSLRDIATNKIHTLFMKPRSRDYIDLYFIFKTQPYSLDALILDAKAKFDWHIDPLTLSSQFLRAKDLTEFPKMLVPFDRTKMEEFYLKLARELGSKILK